VTAGWRREEANAVVLVLHVYPGRSTEIAGRHGDALKIRLAALLRFLSDAFEVPLRNVTLVRGESSRQ